MTPIRHGPDLESIPLADRREELPLKKQFQNTVLNGIAGDPARMGTVVPHCPIPDKIASEIGAFSLNTISFGNNSTPFPKYVRVPGTTYSTRTIVVVRGGAA